MKEQTAEIVAAYLRNNTVATSDIPTVIAQVYQTLSTLSQPPAGPEASALKSAVSVRRSVSDDAITCLECGAKGQMLRRHLKTAHNLTPEDYRDRWNLPAEYPMAAPSYAARRSAMAKAMGLGKNTTRGRKRTSAK